MSVSDFKNQQEILAFAQQQMDRAAAAEVSRDQWKRQSVDWKDLYDSEKLRADTLKSATGDRKVATDEQKLAIAPLIEQINADRDYIKQLGEELSKAQAAKYKWGIFGFGGGYGVRALQPCTR